MHSWRILSTALVVVFCVADAAVAQSLRLEREIEYRYPPACVAYSPNGKLFACGTGGIAFPNAQNSLPMNFGEVVIAESKTGRRIKRLDHSSLVRHIAFSADGRLFVSSTDRQLRVWNVASWKEKYAVSDISIAFGQSLVFSPDSRYLVFCSAFRFKVFDSHTGKRLRVVKLFPGSCSSIRFSPDGRLLAVGSDKGEINFWNTRTWKQSGRIQAHKLMVTGIVFSPDGRTLASASHDKAIYLWEVSTRKKIRKMSGHTRAITTVAFSPDGKLLASGAYDRTLRLWNVSTGKEVFRTGGFAHSSRPVFSPDGKRLASVGKSHTLRIWQVLK